MKILNRPMFRYGGPIKEGIMNGIQEPRRIGYAVKGNVSVADQAKAFENIFTTPNNVTQEQVTQFANRGTPILQGNNQVDQKNDGQTTKDIISNFSGSISQVPRSAYTQDEYRFKKEVDRVNQNIKKRNFIENMNVDDKYIDGYNDQTGQKEKVLNVNYGKDKTLLLNEVTPPVNTKSGENPFNLRDDGDPKQVGAINENPSGLETENTPLTKKERTNNILEMLGYDKAKKNALYDAMINAGQRISRTGLGADNLVSDVIADTSRSYDKPEKLREAANLMRVQQDLKLDQISASKDTRSPIQKNAEYFLKEGIVDNKKDAISMAQGKATDAAGIFFEASQKMNASQALNQTALILGQKEDFGKGVEFKNKIKKEYRGKPLSDFIKSDDFRGDGIYTADGKIIVIQDGEIKNELIIRGSTEDKLFSFGGED